MKVISVLLLIAVLAPVYGARTFTRCSLAREMFALGINKADLAIWACLAEHESSYHTWVVGPPNQDGSKDYGIFQINDRYWCQPADGSFSYNECEISCDNLLTDNIKASVLCAGQVKRQQGWPAWSTWKYCNGPLPSINDCF